MKIKFSQNLIRYLPVYLGISLGDIAKDLPYSRIYIYKLADSAPITDKVNEVLNEYWNNMGMTTDDLNNIYALIDLIEAGKQHNKNKEDK